MRISDWSSDVCSSDLTPVWSNPALAHPSGPRMHEGTSMTSLSTGNGWARRIALSRCLVLLTVPLACLLSGCSESTQADTYTMSTNKTLPTHRHPAISATQHYRAAASDYHINIDL